MLHRYFNLAQAISSLAAHLHLCYSFAALALLMALAACSSSEPELRFSESFIGDHNFTVALNSAGDGLDISFNSQSDASYELLRSSTKACTSSSTTDDCADYFEFQMLGGGSYADSIPERTYYYKLAVSLPGISEDFSAQYPPLDPPGSVTASAGDKQITLSWRGVSGASSYNLYGARVSGVTPDNYASLEDGFLVSGVTSPHVLTDLTNGATYYLVLTAINADDVPSTYSDEVSATPVTPASDNVAPVFTSANSATALENSTDAFYTATATDANGDFVSYSISGGADAALFSLTSGSGALSFINPPDYENPSDSNGDNIYNLSLLASDGVASSAALALSVTVLDLTEIQADYNLSSDTVTINYTLGVDTPEGASVTLYRADEPIGTATCSVLDGISGCINGAFWSDAAIPSSDSIDWSARRYYQLDISADGAIVDRVFADVSVSDYLTMAEPTISDASYEFNLSWQALPNIASYSLYVSTDANATSATAANWSELTNSQVINDVNATSYLLDPDSNTTLYLALSATNSGGVSTNLAPLYQLDSIDYISNGSTWEQAVASASWSARYDHTSVVFDDKLWVIGGYDGDYEDDVWYSEDGVSWTLATAGADWSARYQHASVLFDSKIWVLGGYEYDSGDNVYNDVWYSVNGIDWIRATSSAGWSGRLDHASVAFDGKLWMLGGRHYDRYDDDIYHNDVWYSANGANWTRATSSAGWSGRDRHTSVVFDDKIWVIGGYDGSAQDDVWYSEDGINWTQATSNAGWSGRYDHTSVVFDDKIWVIGTSSDVWYSADGVDWTQATADAGWSARDEHSSVVFDNRLWVLGGGSGLNDVWYSTATSIDSFSFTPLDYDYAPAQNQGPAFTSAASVSTDENNLSAYTSTGEDPDDATLAFAIAGGADSALFTIDSSSGELAFLTAPDYENPADSDADNVYQLNLQLSDGSADTELDLAISVSNVVEALPAPQGLSAQLIANELRLSWQAVSSANLDGGAASYNIYYATSGGVNADNYSELAGSAERDISTTDFTFALNSFSADTRYYFAVSAENSFNESPESDELSVLISADINNSSPLFTSSDLVEVPENTAFVFHTASANDTDGDNLSYALSGGADAALFALDSSSGELNFIAAPDYEAPTDSDGNNLYSLTLSVSDAYYAALQSLSVSVADMAANANLQAEYNSSTNLVDISFNLDNDLSYQLLRSYAADCAYQSISSCSGGVELAYTEAGSSATATDSINFDQTQYYQLIASDSESRTEIITTSINGAEQLQDFVAAHQLLVEYNSSTDLVDIHLTNFPDAASYTLHLAEEPIGTATCSVIDGISGCTNGASWSDTAIPSTDAIDWSARNYYQLDISVDDVVIDRLTADLSVSDYLTMAEPTVSTNGYQFDLSWQSLPNLDSYSLYIATDADATSALEANWSSLEGSQIINDLNETHYLLDPDSNNTTLYFALSATNSEGVSTDLAPLHKLDNIDHVSDGSVWFQTTANAGWSARSSHTSVVFDDKLWVIGGYDGSREDDVWYSADGVTWTQATASAGWSARYGHTSVVFDDKLWVIGGDDGSSQDDVWYSEDGVNWTQATATAGWSARYDHTSVVFDDKLWVIGGDDGSSQDDVWYSEDGVNWTQATATAGWSARYEHTSVVFDDKLWVIGGDDGSSQDDVWYSEDGVNWTQATATAGWSARYEHTSVVFDDKLWVIGSYDGSRQNDVWYSADGESWQEATTTAGWSGRSSHTSVVFNDKLWVLGGYDGSREDDVWYSPLLINTFNFTPLDYDYAPPQNQVPGFTSATSATIDENTIAAYTATGADPDDGTITFAIAGGADADSLSIDPDSGELRFLAAPDYENPADSDGDNVYQLALRLSDGSADSDLEAQITVINVNEIPPAPTGLSARMVSDELRLSWDSLPDDTDGDILTYNLYYAQHSGVDAEDYEVRQSNISANSFTFALSNFSADTSYNFVVSATNEIGESAESKELSVLITSGVDNTSPLFTSAESTVVLENTTSSFYTASASDADNDNLAFAIAGGADAALFSLGANSGELRFLAAPDYENPSDSDADNIYSLTLSVADTYATAQYSLSVSVADMAAGANLQAQYNSSTNLVDISFNTESGLSYQLQRSYEADCDHLQPSACAGYQELAYTQASNTASATDSIDFAESQYYQLLATDAEGRTELITTSINGAEQRDDFISAHQLLVEYNLSTNVIDIHIDNFPEAANASYALYRAEEPLGTDTCSILDGISACTNDASWSDAAIPSTDAIDWSARRYYQLDIIVDDVVIDRLTADLAVSDYLTMAEPTISTDGYEFNLSWQALPNVASYSLYIATDADATTATDANWSSLAGAQTITAISRANYSLYPNGAETLYLALTATNQSDQTTNLAPLYQLNSVDYGVDASIWRQATDAPGWSVRYAHTSLVADDKLWVLGGNDGNYEDDVWYSTDGVSWNEATPAANWSGRHGHSSAIFKDGQIWVLGGYNGSYLNDVWYSADGGDWDQATTPGWGGREHHTSLVFKEQLWLLGGYDGSTRLNEAWYSADGVSWIEATATTDAGWVGRSHHSSAVFKDKLWILGGYDGSRLDDIWYTEDGYNWDLATAEANWSARNSHTSVVFDDMLWVIGGWDGSNRLDDVWYSDDGINWTQATAEADWSARSHHASVVFNNQLWVLGGTNGNRLDDVWYSPLLINTFNFTPLDYDYAPARNQAPAFTSAASATVDENTIDAYTATGTDPDDGTLAFTIAGGADAALFSIDASSGKLSFSAYPDYENPADSGADNAYQVDLGIHDGSAAGDERSVSITVLNETESPTTPVIVQALAGDGEATLNWQIVNDADEYRVYWSTDSDLSLSNFSDRQDVDSSFTGATISNLNNGTIYYFFVTAVNNLGESAESSVVSVKPQSGDTNQAPTAAAGADQTVSEGKTVYLVGSGSDADGSIAQYTWSSVSSSISIVDSDSSDGNASFIAPEVDASGDSFTLTLRVTDNDDASGLDTMIVTVENNEAPIVNAGVNQSAVAGTTVNLKGSASDSDGTVVAYSWQETSASSVNSGGVSISRSDSATASITVPELDAGDELTFELTATDDDGSSASAQTKLTVAASGSFKWSFATGGSIYSSPAIALDGSIYFGSDDGKLYALHPDGSEDWNYTTGDMVRSAPAIGADGSIYFGSDDNKLYALNPDGSENWNYPTGGVVRSSPALAADGGIYFGSADGKLYALNPDGSEDWNYTSGNAIHSAPTISSEGIIYFGDSSGIVHELNSSGDVQRFFASAGAIYTSVALDPANDQLYFSNRNGNIYALSTSSAASWDSSLWSFAANNLDSAPVVAEDGTIYIGSFDDARLYALATDGSILSDKFYSSAGAINATGTLGADARIYFSSGNSNLYALDISSATETRLDWEYNIGWSSVSDAPAAPAVAIASDGTVYVGSTDGKLYALHSASAGLAASSWPRFAQDNHNLGRINIVPSAEAGSDQDVAAGATVNLDGSSSSDPDGAIVDYYWQETSGFGISITNNSSAQASFTAPDDLSTDATLTIQLTVTDNSGATATDTLEVSVPATNSDPVAQ